MNERHVPWALLALGLVVHTLWASTQPSPTEMDAQYYLAVAQNIAEGRGAVTRSLWNLSYLPPDLPMPADLHWMPLPSRVIVPGVLLGAGGDRLLEALLAACWGPLAWRLAGHLPVSRPWLAGLLALAGGVYARLLSSPDCYALYGLLGGLGLLAVAERRVALAVAVGALAALTRNDGLLWAPCLALGLTGPARWLVGASGPLAFAAWTLRNHTIGGADWWEARRLVTSTTDYVVMFDGVPRAMVDLPGRFAALVHAWSDLLAFWLTPGMIVLTLPAAWAMWQRREDGWVRTLGVYLALAPLAAVWAAPALATHGTLYRSGAATLCGQLALAVLGLEALAEAGQRLRGYPRPFTLGLLSGAFVLVSAGQGWTQAHKRARVPECDAVADLPPGEPVFTSRPLEMELRCDRPGVMITRGITPERAAEVAERYGVRFVVVAEPGWRDEGSITADDVERVLPGWEPVGERLFGGVGR